MVSPSTPVPMTNSMSRARLASSTAPGLVEGRGHDVVDAVQVLDRGHGSARTMPPSTGTMAPLTYEAAGESRKAATRPISSVLP